MKKVFISIFALLLLLCNANAYEIDEDTSSSNILIVNLDNSQVIYSKGSNKKIYPASMSKIMSAIVLAENANLDETITINEEDLKGLKEADASIIGFDVDEEVKVRDLLYAILLPSGADACNAASRITFNSNKEFVKQMNKKAKDIGMKSTNFVNNTGLHDDNHYSTTYDIYLLMKYALENKEVSKVLKKDKYVLTTNIRSYILKPSALAVANKFNIDLSYYQAGKTGFTGEAGRCLVALYEHNDERYIIVSSNADEESYTSVIDHNVLSENIINNYKYVNIYDKNHEFQNIDVKYSFTRNISVNAKDKVSLVLPVDYDKNKLKVEYVGKTTLMAPLAKNTHIGSSVFSYDNKEIYRIEHYLDESIERSEIVYYYDITYKFLQDNKYVVVIVILALVLIGYVLIRRKKDIKI